ncbi:MAG: hypothetical protein AB1633_07445, partial [Elusimicrobiota bacterium]
MASKYDSHQFALRLKSKNIPKICYFSGEEVFLQESTLQEIEFILKDSSPEKVTFYGSTLDLNEFLSVVNSQPLFGNVTLVILKETNKIKATVEKNLVSQLRTNIENILINSYVIFISSLKSFRLNQNELYKFVLETGETV